MFGCGFCHSTVCCVCVLLIYSCVYLEGRKCVIFYLQLYGIEHSDSERRNPLLLLHGLFFPISNKGSFMCTISLAG